MSVKGRFAPSPTGRMHLGNICAALISRLSAKSRGGEWLLRIEDLDPQRSKPEYIGLLEQDLRALGMTHDEGGTEGRGDDGPYLQSQRDEIYSDALRRLNEMGLLYRCRCTRADIMATQAPHQSDGRVVYNGNCRPSDKPPFPPIDINEKGVGSIRLRVPDEEIEFEDRWCGKQTMNLARDCGDFIVRRSDGAWGYQLAVVVDDALMGVTEVVRGEDLLLSTAQQIYIYRLLGYDVPEFAHFPLVRNESGERLSKRDRAESMESLLAQYGPEEILGLAAFKAGIIPSPVPHTPDSLITPYRLWEEKRNH